MAKDKATGQTTIFGCVTHGRDNATGQTTQAIAEVIAVFVFH
jgi:hypothetical protein